MTVHKLSISVPPEVEEIIKAAAAEKGQSVSAWVAEAAQYWARADARQAEGLAAAQEMVAEYEAENGPIPEEEKQRARRFIAEHVLVDDDQLAVAG